MNRAEWGREGDAEPAGRETPIGEGEAGRTLPSRYGSRDSFVSAQRRIFFVIKYLGSGSCGHSSLCALGTPPLASLLTPSDAEALSGALAKDECLVCISPLHFRPLFGPPQQEMGEPRSGASLYFAYYNFCRVHSSIKATPAVKAGLAVETWSLARDHWLTISDPSAEPNGALIFALTGYGSGRFCARRVWACKLSSRRRRVENRDRQPTKVSDVERKQPGDCVALHRCHKTNVMRPEANHAMGLHECQPEFA